MWVGLGTESVGGNVRFMCFFFFYFLCIVTVGNTVCGGCKTLFPGFEG